MTSDDRARMRATLRAAVAQAKLPGAELRHPGPFEPPTTAAYPLEERFRAEVTALGGNIHEGRDRDHVVSIIVGLVAAEATRKVLAWDDRSLPIDGLGAALTAAGVTVLTQTPDTAASNTHRVELASASVGVTGADAGLAQTGSIVVTSGPGRGRLASLLPRVHVALLRRSLIVESLPVLIARRPELVTAGANFVCITGPSRTADIEHVLARGVHGPGEVHVILVE